MGGHADDICDLMEDLQMKILDAAPGKSGAERDAVRTEVCTKGDWFKLCQKLEDSIKESGNPQKGCAVGSNMSTADVMMYVYFANQTGGLMDGVPANALDPFPGIQAVRKAVANHPRVKPYIDKCVADKKIKVSKGYVG